jgi:class 3 adenylate cyclase
VPGKFGTVTYPHGRLHALTLYFIASSCQVFTLLETLFHAFDEIAKKRRIFKVETVGDCYVAVAGLPEARKDHAVAMARFARDCLQRTQILTRKLELTLGPDTADLAMRMGKQMHK